MIKKVLHYPKSLEMSLINRAVLGLQGWAVGYPASRLAGGWAQVTQDLSAALNQNPPINPASAATVGQGAPWPGMQTKPSALVGTRPLGQSSLSRAAGGGRRGV